MGFHVEVGGYSYRLDGFSVQEASTPLAGGDSSGQVGTISLNLIREDPYEFPAPPITDAGVPVGDANFRKFGPAMLLGKPVRLTDTNKGFTLGKVTGVNSTDFGAFSLECESRLGALNIYGVQAEPFNGTLQGAFEYYLSLAGITTDLFVDPDIAGSPVIAPGWNGELWYHLKQLAVAESAEVSLVSGIILLRALRTREAIVGRDISRSRSLGGSLAQAVEVYHYDNQPITDQLVYPPGGWNDTVSVINVNAGELVEEVVELSASVSSIQQPVMQTFVSRDHNTSSVFTIVGDDGLPVTPAAWNNAGGSLSVEINPDTTSLTVKIQAPTSIIPNKDGQPIGVYSVSLSSDSSTGRYSTLRIIGSGVAFEKNLVTFPTGLTAREAGTEVGITIDNPFLSDLNQLYRAGTRAARRFTGRSLSLSTSVTAVNKLGDSGIATYPTYGQVKTSFSSQTYGQVKTSFSGQTYGDVKSDLFASVQNDFESQVFGNVNGARVWDSGSKRWYRVRSATLAPDTIQIQADDDLTYGDVQGMWDLEPSNTYGFARSVLGDLTYGEVNLAGLVMK